jgi:hypothetical protein
LIFRNRLDKRLPSKTKTPLAIDPNAVESVFSFKGLKVVGRGRTKLNEPFHDLQLCESLDRSFCALFKATNTASALFHKCGRVFVMIVSYRHHRDRSVIYVTLHVTVKPLRLHTMLLVGFSDPVIIDSIGWLMISEAA